MQRINATAWQGRNPFPATIEKIGKYLLKLYCRFRFGGDVLYLSEREALLIRAPRLTENQIVCFNCNGHKSKPVRTQLTDRKTCHGCGGDYYLHASSYVMEIAVNRVREEAKR